MKNTSDHVLKLIEALKEDSLLDFLREQAQETTNKIQQVINPIDPVKLPIIAFSLKTIISSLEEEMDEEQKKVTEDMLAMFGTKKQVIRVKKGTLEALKEFDAGGGRVDGLQDLSVLWRLFRP